MPGKIVGYITELTGSAEIRTPEGNIKLVAAGDAVAEGDLLITEGDIGDPAVNANGTLNITNTDPALNPTSPMLPLRPATTALAPLSWSPAPGPTRWTKAKCKLYPPAKS